MRRRLALVASAALALLVLAGGPAGAHPLGNFTTNTSANLVIAPQEVRIDYVVDLAEVPALRVVQQLDADGGGAVSPTEGSPYAAQECASLADGIALVVDGAPAPAAVTGSNLAFLPGQAGLTTLRLECALRAPLLAAGGERAITFADTNLDGRIGWREVTAIGEGMALVASDVPTASLSDRLRTYPQDRINAPLDVRAATVRARPGSGAEGVLPGLVPGAPGRGLGRFATAFTDTVAREDLTLAVGVAGLALAVALGALHALAPGHGKTVMAAVLVSRDGSGRQALGLALTVATTHTLGVLLLGLLFTVTEVLSPDRVYAWLGVASGLLFAGVGVTLLRSALARRRAGLLGDHDHGPGTHVHGPGGHVHGASTAPALRAAEGAAGAVAVATRPAADHDHGHGHGHDHSPPGGRAGVRWQQLVVPGLAGGLVPSPSALLVLLGGIALNRAWFGVALVVAYGLGMAAVLVGAGYLLLRARTAVAARTEGARFRLVFAVLPMVTACLVIAAGAGIALRSAVAAL